MIIDHRGNEKKLAQFYSETQQLIRNEYIIVRFALIHMYDLTSNNFKFCLNDINRPIHKYVSTNGRHSYFW